MTHQLLRNSERSAERFTVRDLALVAVFAAILAADGYVSSLAREVTRNLDTFFLISLLFTLLALFTRKRGTSTILAVVSGLIFLAVPGAPAPQHITLPLIANGIVFDIALILMLSRSSSPNPTRNQLVVAGSIGMGVMSIAALELLAIFVPVALASIPFVVLPALVFADSFIGALGALFGFSVARRFHVTRVQEPSLLRY